MRSFPTRLFSILMLAVTVAGLSACVVEPYPYRYHHGYYYDGPRYYDDGYYHRDHWRHDW